MIVNNLLHVKHDNDVWNVSMHAHIMSKCVVKLSTKFLNAKKDERTDEHHMNRPTRTWMDVFLFIARQCSSGESRQNTATVFLIW